MLKYICGLVCCYKQLNGYMYIACQGVCINAETLLESFKYLLKIYLSLNILSCTVHIAAEFSLEFRT